MANDSSGIPIGEAQLVAIFVQAIVYGVYLVTTGHCAYVLFGGGKGTKRRCLLICVAAAMMVVTTLNIAVCFRYILDVFIIFSGPLGPDGGFQNKSTSTLDDIQIVTTGLMTIIADGMLVYRCFVIFTHRRGFVILPLLLWLCDIAVLGVNIWSTVSLTPDAALHSRRMTDTLLIFFGITVLTNLLTTGLIVWRIRSVDKVCSDLITIPRRKRSRLSNVTRIIVESGLLYTTFVAVAFIAMVAGDYAAYDIVLNMIPPIAGISFNLIIIRVDKGVAVGGTYTDSTAGNVGTANPIVFLHSGDSTDTGTTDMSTRQLESGTIHSK